MAGPVMLAATAPELNRGDVLGGRYQIEAVIGSGGSGRVLRAFDRVSKAPVALKILRPEFAADPVWTERFSRELRVGRQIQHPNVCRVFDIGDADGNRFLSMELATGGTVRSQLEPGSMPRTAQDRITDARAVIAGVAALHTAGIVHRDIKPENILRMGDGRLVVSDFGLATDPGAGPATTVMIGTPRYMAPEVVMGDPGTTRSDVWALGVVLHEILSGKRPDRTQMKHRRRVYTPPEGTTPTDRRLLDLCARCSEEDPEERPASAVEVAREFEAALRGERLTRKFARKQVAWGAVALAALGTLGLIRNRWTSNAVASSSQVAGAIADRVLLPTGTPEDWSKVSKELATFPGRLHCFSLTGAGKKVRVIWGSPRKADDVEISTGARTPSNLLPETYVDGCPKLSPDGRSLLFEKTGDAGTHVFLSPAGDGRDAKQLVRGGSPEWLPNGQEFSFALDTRHAAIFAIPTSEMTLVSDGETSPRLLAESTANVSGTRLAVRYTTEALGNLVVIHDLPGLGVVGRMRLPQSARQLRFKGSRVLFSQDGRRRDSVLASADWLHAATRLVGEIPGADVRATLGIGEDLLIAARHLRKDLWLMGTNGANSRLTSDGVSDSGSLSNAGSLVAQRLLPDGRYVMVLRERDEIEKQITQGPMDVTPTFSPDGRVWIYSRLNSGELVQCNAAGSDCSPIHKDPLIPGFPSVDPSGQTVAYLTLMNAPRIRLVSRTGAGLRDLGPAGGDACSPYWSSGSRIWVAQTAAADQQSWVEIDLVSGQRTGSALSARLEKGQNCALPQRLLKGALAEGTRPIAVVSEEISVLSIRPHGEERLGI